MHAISMFAMAAAVALAAGSACAADAEVNADDTRASVEELRNLSIEQLANLPVTSVSKRPQSLASAPASVFVITADDIRRSGATSLPEALRIAPNLEVARIDTDAYAISARGFNSAESANKLLVMINGRSVYEPVGSGILWQQVDVVLSNIDHIEVVTGPAGTLWGANAVNGVIDIVLKRPETVEGLNLLVRGGDFDREIEGTYGGVIGGVVYRASIAAFDQTDLPKLANDPTRDAFRGVHGVVRFDDGAAGDGMSLVAAAYHNEIEDQGGIFEGGDIAFHVNRPIEATAFQASAYVSTDSRYEPTLSERRTTFNVQVQDAFAIGRNKIVAGAEGRVWLESFRSFNIFHFADPDATISLASIFAQDDVAMRPDLTLTAGLKLEYNSYSGADWMPSLRLAWSPAPDLILWGAVSRAVRTPNRIERELIAPPLLAASPTFQSEKLWAFETGYRGQFTGRLSLSATLYYDHYDDLRTDEFTDGGLPIVLRNGAEGSVYGIEAWATLDLTSWWRLKAGGTALHKDIQIAPGHSDLAELQVAGLDPDYQGQIRSQMDLGRNVDLDLALRTVGSLKQVGFDQVVTPAYTEADARIGWRLRPNLEIAVVGLNLLHDRHLEIDDTSTAPLRFVARSGYVELRYGF